MKKSFWSKTNTEMTTLDWTKWILWLTAGIYGIMIGVYVIIFKWEDILAIPKNLWNKLKTCISELRYRGKREEA